MMHDALRGDVLAALLADNDEARRQVEDDVQEHAEKFDADITKNSALPLQPELLNALRAAQPDIRSYIDSAKEMIRLAKIDRETALARMPKFQTSFGIVEERMEAISDQVEACAHAAARKAGSDARWSIAGVGIIAPPLLLLIASLVTRSITRPLARLTAGLARAAESVIRAADESSRASQSIADGAHKQAASLEQTRTTSDQLASATDETARSCAETNERVEEARRAAANGDAVMTELSAAMREITESATRVEKIIKVIEEIAFQTNLLALNAAVEAARAGEHGRGFAVVAEEVRNLAQRAGQAARETSSQLADSVSRAKHGASITNQVVQALTSVRTSVTRAAEISSSISRAMQSQSTNVSHIAHAIGTIDAATQANVAAAEEFVTSATSLKEQGEQLGAAMRELEGFVRGRVN